MVWIRLAVVVVERVKVLGWFLICFEGRKDRVADRFDIGYERKDLRMMPGFCLSN